MSAFHVKAISRFIGFESSSAWGLRLMVEGPQKRVGILYWMSSSHLEKEEECAN